MNRSHVLQASVRSSRQQRGVTLIELLVSMMLGVFVVAGAIQIFVGSKQTYRIQEAVSQLQENGRFALDLFQQSLRMAGYRNDPAKEINSVFINYGTFGLSQGLIIKGFDGVGAGSNADSIIFRYSSPSSNSQSNCLAIDITGDTVVQYSLDDDGALRCAINDSVVQPVVSGVRDMELLYGVDLDSNRSVETYLTATDVTSNNNWLHVVSIKVALLISTDADNIASEPQTYIFPPVNFGAESRQNTAADHRLYRVFSATVNLRNRTQ
jgi:type IV pilus assembly protein PilW